MIGCPVAWKCLVACLFGESSQQPTCTQLRQIRRCSPTLPVFRHSSQPSALGVTLRMPAMWVQPFAMSGSNFAGIEENHIGASGGEGLHIRRRSLALGAGKASLYRREIVEGQRRDQMEAGRARGGRDRTLADPVFPQTRNFLGDRDVLFEIVLVESSGILWRLVHHHEFSHRVSPFEVATLGSR